jgi:hypothetical protein
MKKYGFLFLIVILTASFLTTPAYAIGPTLYAGQNQIAGYVQITDDGTDLTVQIIMKGGEGWCLKEASVHVADELADFPLTGSGNPKIGQFDWKIDYGDNCVNGATFVIPLPASPSNSDIYIAVHAVVVGPDGQEETGWAVRCGDLWGAQFGGSSWAAYIWYPV